MRLYNKVNKRNCQARGMESSRMLDELFSYSASHKVRECVQLEVKIGTRGKI